VDIEHGLFIVADGLGGHSAGDKAARMAMTFLPGIIHSQLIDAPAPSSSGDGLIGAALAKSVEELSRLIRETGNSQVECRGMGTTVVAALITARHIHIAYMGDSRAYLLRGDCMRQITEDHSIVSLLVRHGEITPQEAENHPAKGRLSRFAGMEGDVPSATITIDLEAGDRFLLCTDGVWGALSDAKIREMLMQDNTPVVTCGNLIEAGKQAGGQDNLTSVVVDVEETT
jgi:protein phosphatase